MQMTIIDKISLFSPSTTVCSFFTRRKNMLHRFLVHKWRERPMRPMLFMLAYGQPVEIIHR